MRREQASPRAAKSAERMDGAMMAGGVMFALSCTSIDEMLVDYSRMRMISGISTSPWPTSWRDISASSPAESASWFLLHRKQIKQRQNKGNKREISLILS
jgi:hypothetical protein